MDLSNKKVLFYDLGIFQEVAVRLARDFEKVYYFIPWIEAFPKLGKARIGEGFEGLERIRYFRDYIDKVDLIVFPDTHCADEYEFLKKHGYPVAGVGEAEALELDRLYGRQVQQKAGLPTQETKEIVGMKELAKFLEKDDDVFVKMNTYRGEIESFHGQDFPSIKTQLAHDLGPYMDTVHFIVEERIDGIEPGIDAIVYDGAVISPTIVGFEIKGAGYIGKVVDYEKVPIQLKSINDKMEPVLKKMNYRFFFSSEAKVPNKKDGYMIDFCCRMAAPVPNAIQIELIENFSEVVWGFGTGERVVPKYKAKYGAGASLYSEWSEKGHWLQINFPKNLRQWLKFRQAAIINGEFWSFPNASTNVTVIAIGDTVDDVIGQVQERSEEVKAYMLDKQAANFVELKEELEEAKHYGFDFNS